MVFGKIRKIGQCITPFIAQHRAGLTAKQLLLSLYKPGSKSSYSLYRTYRRDGDSLHDLPRQNTDMGYYFDLSQFRAAAVAFNTLLNTYPDSQKSDEYKLMSIKSYFRFAELSIEEKKSERFEKVVQECNDFTDRFPQSPLL